MHKVERHFYSVQEDHVFIVIYYSDPFSLYYFCVCFMHMVTSFCLTFINLLCTAEASS